MIIKLGITAWRRSDYFAQVVERLRACWGAMEHEYFVSVDGGYPESQLRHREIFAASGLRGDIVLQEGNLGCCENTGLVFKRLFAEGADAVIMLEDDTVPAIDFLYYMRSMLERFREDMGVFSVSGFHRRLRTDTHALYPSTEGNIDEQMSDGMSVISFQLPRIPRISTTRASIGPGRPDAIFLRRRMQFNGWGTWRRIYDEIGDGWFGITAKWGVEELTEGEMFLKQVKIDPRGRWDWPLMKYWRKGRSEVAPDLSRIQNIGAKNGAWSTNPEYHRRYQQTEIWLNDQDGHRGDFELLRSATGVQKVY